MVQALVNQWIRELREFKYGTWLTTILAGILVIFSAQRGYEWYVISYEQKAQLAMAEALEEYDRVLYQMIEEKQSTDVIRQRFEDTHVGFDVVTNGYSRSHLISSTYGFSSSAYWFSDKKDESFIAIDKAITLAKKSPLYFMFQTKKALMLIDAGNVQEGIDQLIALSQDTKNPNADTAAFYLGYYYWSQKDAEKAREAWKTLEKYGPGAVTIKRGVSPWLMVAQEKMNLIS